MDQDLAHSLAAGRRSELEAHERLGTIVAEARRRGCSWEQIAAVVGMSRQAAHERWRHLDPG